MSETEQHTDSGDYTYEPDGHLNGWTCATCGQWVPDATAHVCPGADLATTAEPLPTPTMPEMSVVIGPAGFKTTDMLILEVLEKMHKRLGEIHKTLRSLPGAM